MKFSLFLNTRQRLPLLTNLLRSIDATFSYTNEIEILLGVDDDDVETKNFLTHLDFILGDIDLCSKISCYSTERPSNLHTKMNSLADQSSGDILFVLNDDVEFMSDNWDILTISNLEKMTNAQDNIYYLATKDTSVDKTTGKNYASFPMLTREAYTTLGYFMSEKFVGLGGDVHLWRIFDTVNRVIDNSEVVLDHVRHNTLVKVISPDRVAFQMRENTQLNYVDGWSVDISQEVKKINAEIASSL